MADGQFPEVQGVEIDFGKLRASDFAAFRRVFGVSVSHQEGIDGLHLSTEEFGSFWYSRLQRKGDTPTERYETALETLSIPDANLVYDEVRTQVFPPETPAATEDTSTSGSTDAESPES